MLNDPPSEVVCEKGLGIFLVCGIPGGKIEYKNDKFYVSVLKLVAWKKVLYLLELNKEDVVETHRLSEEAKKQEIKQKKQHLKQKRLKGFKI